MKKFTLTILVFFSFLIVNAQAKDTIYVQLKTNGQWQKNSLEILSYNAFCSIDSDLRQEWDTISLRWTNAYLYTYTYDASGNVIQILTQVWDKVNNQWLNNSLSIYSTRNNGEIFISTGQYWDVTTSSWINSSRFISTLNSVGSTSYFEFQNYFNNEWQNLFRIFIDFTADNLRKSDFSQNWINNEWVNNYKTVYEQTNDNSKETSHGYYWNSFTNEWTKTARSFADLLQGTGSAEKWLGQYYTGFNWENSNRQNTKYNADNKPLSSFSQQWDLSSQTWVKSFKSIQEYYPDGSSSLSQFEVWDVLSRTWKDGYRATYTNNSCLLDATITQLSPADKSNPLNMYAVQNKKAGGNAAISSVLNQNTGNGHQLVYDFSVKAKTNLQDAKQFNWQLILSTKPKNKAVNTQSADAALAKNISGFGIAPNPAKNYFTVTLKQPANNDNTILKLTDISGRLIMQQKLQNSSTQKITIPASLPKGLYIVTVLSGKEIFKQKLVVE